MKLPLFIPLLSRVTWGMSTDPETPAAMAYSLLADP